MRQYLPNKTTRSLLFGLFLIALSILPQSAFAGTFSPRSFSNPIFFASSVVFAFIFVLTICLIAGRFSVLS